MISILFVCLGNICRSPMAEAIFNHQVRARGLESGLDAASCGTANYHVGDDADPRTRAAVRSKGIAIDHCVRQLTVHDLDHYDYVVAMDRSNYQNIHRLSKQGHKAKVILMRDFDPGHEREEVPDPYYGNQKNFEEVYEILDRSIRHFIDHLVAGESAKLSGHGQRPTR